MPVTGGSQTIRVEGLAELRKALRQADKELPKELAAANQAAAEIVAEEARRRAPRGEHEGGGQVAPVFSSIRAAKRQNVASVSIGGPRSPHAPVLEFGGTIPRRGFRGAGKLGRAGKERLGVSVTRVRAQPYLYPAIAAKREEVRETYGELLDELSNRIAPT